MPLALARMKRIWITKHVGKKQLGRERNNQTPYIRVKKVVAVLFLLGNNRGISGMISYYVKARQWS